MSAAEDGGTFWLSEAQADVLAHEYNAQASPLFLTGTTQMIVEGFQKYGRLQVCCAVRAAVPPPERHGVLCPLRRHALTYHVRAI